VRKIKVLFANFITLQLLFAAPLALAQEPHGSAPMNFQAWKDQQVLEAQNQVLRASNRLSQLKAGRSSLGSTAKEPTKLNSDKIKKADSDPILSAERELKRSQEGLEAATNLEFTNYVDVYLPTLREDPESLQKLAERLSKEELTQIFKSIMGKGNSIDAKRNAAILEGLSGTSTFKNQ
jgi:hypothetical protein